MTRRRHRANRKPPQAKPVPEAVTTLGIDLGNRNVKYQVEAIVLSQFGQLIRANGWSEEEALQEVMKALLIRNAGKCPFDPAKTHRGTIAGYVCMVAKQLFTRMWKSEHRRKGHERLGVFSFASRCGIGRDSGVSAGERAQDGYGRENVDAAFMAQVPAEGSVQLWRDIVGKLLAEGRECAAEIFPLRAAGKSLEDCALETGWDYFRVVEADVEVKRAVLAYCKERP